MKGENAEKGTRWKLCLMKFSDSKMEPGGEAEGEERVGGMEN